jgi:hypothetical protein
MIRNYWLIGCPVKSLMNIGLAFIAFSPDSILFRLPIMTIASDAGLMYPLATRGTSAYVIASMFCT